MIHVLTQPQNQASSLTCFDIALSQTDLSTAQEESCDVKRQWEESCDVKHQWVESCDVKRQWVESCDVKRQWEGWSTR